MVERHSAVLSEILQERVVSSRGRHNPRGVKRNISRYPQRARSGFEPRPASGPVRAKIVK